VTPTVSGSLCRIMETGKGLQSRGGQILSRALVADELYGGRADCRFVVDGSGELYIVSKSDGVVRAVVGVVKR
jgi:hypothetical protein